MVDLHWNVMKWNAWKSRARKHKFNFIFTPAVKRTTNDISNMLKQITMIIVRLTFHHESNHFLRFLAPFAFAANRSLADVLVFFFKLNWINSPLQSCTIVQFRFLSADIVYDLRVQTSCLQNSGVPYSFDKFTLRRKIHSWNCYSHFSMFEIVHKLHTLAGWSSFRLKFMWTFSVWPFVC